MVYLKNFNKTGLLVAQNYFKIPKWLGKRFYLREANTKRDFSLHRKSSLCVSFDLNNRFYSNEKSISLNNLKLFEKLFFQTNSFTKSIFCR